MKIKCLLLFLIILFKCNVVTTSAQDSDSIQALKQRIISYFKAYEPKNQEAISAARVQSVDIIDTSKTIVINMSDNFSEQEFTPEIVDNIYKNVYQITKPIYKSYDLNIISKGFPIEQLISNRLRKDKDKKRQWNHIDYKGQSWVQNVSRPNEITQGLEGRHLSIWSSHGIYYDIKSDRWKWQRPYLFCTTEDLYTQTIVNPYLIPMLENAGAIVFSPKERDWQKNEYIVDNDMLNKYPYYTEYNTGKHKWESATGKGFALKQDRYRDNESPFEGGTFKTARTTRKKNQVNLISYQPDFKESGRYAVYVCYQTVAESVDDAQYIVFHKGQTTEFKVNQQMGDGTWVYLGTFDFDSGCSPNNRVIVTNYSHNNGVVTSDAIRFGGGMGLIERGDNVSGMPKALEGSRYYAQWAGAPYSVYSSKNGTDDYADDINSRSYMTNWLAGGSVFVPNTEGKRVPIELSLAVHSDAGVAKDGTSFIGSLSICTTDFNNKQLDAGISRLASRDFADILLSEARKDITYKYGKWARRSLYDRNYSETRVPKVPSAIFETLSHQNFPDMRYGQDPNFKFTLARSIYKSILKYVATQHGKSYTVTPLAPHNFKIEYIDKKHIKLSWSETEDKQEPTAKPSSYNIYTSVGSGGFDNGINVKTNSYTLELSDGIPYHFKVTAVNRGGESFPTETLSAVYHPKAHKTILVVNGFRRLASPQVINNSAEQGFDISEDMGVSYGMTAGWSGQQLNFNKSNMGIEGENGLGYSGNELSGHFIAGNTFDYVSAHATAIASAQRYNVASCSVESIENGSIDLTKYDCVDLILGLERDDGYSLKQYKTFSKTLQDKLASYTKRHGKLIVSGSYVGYDMQAEGEKAFLKNVLKIQHTNTYRTNNNVVFGLGNHFNFYNAPNERHYAAMQTDILQPVASAYCVMQYDNGSSAAVAYKGNDYRCITVGFPLECITDHNMRNSIIRGLINFVLE